jgi:hypothetical protein
MSDPAFAFTSRWRPFVAVGVGATRTPGGLGVWGVSLWGDPGATWNGGEPIWVAVDCEVNSASWGGGRDWSLDRFPAGTATLRLANVTGWATDETDPATALRPGRQLMFGVTDRSDGSNWSLFRGFIDAVTPQFDPEGGDVVQVAAFDPLGELGLYERPAPDGSLIGAGETGDARFRRLLAFASWPASLTGAIDPSPVPMAGRPFDQPFAEELGITADSEGGAVVCDLLGRVCYRGRDWLTWPADEGTIWAIGNTDTAGEVCPSAVELSDDRSDIANRVRLATETDLIAPTIDDTASQALYGVLTLSREDLICADVGQLSVLARRMLAVKAPGGKRVRSVTLDAATDPDRIVPMLLTADVSASPPIRARLALEVAGSSRFDQLGVLQSVAHEWVPPAVWTCRLGFDLADPYVRDVGRWDHGTWGETVWAVPVREEVSV